MGMDKGSSPVARDLHGEVAVEATVAFWVRAVALALVATLTADVAVLAVELVVTIMVGAPHSCAHVRIVTQAPLGGETALALYFAIGHFFKADSFAEHAVVTARLELCSLTAIEKRHDACEIVAFLEGEWLRRAQRERVERDATCTKDAPRDGGTRLRCVVLSANAHRGSRTPCEHARARSRAARTVTFAPIGHVVTHAFTKALALHGAVASGNVALALAVFRPLPQKFESLQTCAGEGAVSNFGRTGNDRLSGM